MRRIVMFWIGALSTGTYFTWVLVAHRTHQLVRRIRTLVRTRKVR